MKSPPFWKHPQFNKPFYIHVGKQGREWAMADIKHGSQATFLPYGEEVGGYRWPIGGQYVVVCDQGGMTQVGLQKICLGLLEYRPKIIYLWSEKYACQFFKGAKK